MGDAELTPPSDSLEVVDCNAPSGAVATTYCALGPAGGEELEDLRAAAQAISEASGENCQFLGDFAEFFMTSTDRMRVFSGTITDSSGNQVLARTFTLANGDPGVMLSDSFFNGGYLWQAPLGGDPNFSYLITLQAALAHEMDHVMNAGPVPHYDQFGNSVTGYSPFTANRSCYGS